MSYVYPPYDARAYYVHPQQPPAGYPAGHPPAPPTPSSNGYPPLSPTAQAPARPHTTAPFPTASQFAPPPGVYYGVPPPQNGHPPPTPTAAPPSAGSYPPPAPQPGAAPFGDMSPEQLQGMIDQLQSLKMNKAAPAPGPSDAPVAGAGHATDSSLAVDTSMPPPGAHGVPQSARGPMPPHAYPYPYPYNRPASHSGEVSPPAPPHAYHHPSAPSKAAAPMPGSFFSDAPAPPQAPAPPPKTPGPSGRPESSRKPSGQASEISFASSKSHDMSHAWEQWGGSLVEMVPGREPRPKPKLLSLFRGIAAYMIALLEPTGSCVVTLGKLIQFYNTFPVGSDPEAADWQRFFRMRSSKVLSQLFCTLNVDHHLVPVEPGQEPTEPGMTPRGFEVWMFTLLMTAPHREWIRISKILDHWTIFDQGKEMPKVMPRECLPKSEDRAIFQGWWHAVRDDYPEESSDSDDERKVPLGLPEPAKRRRGYSIRGGDLPHEEDDSKDSSTAAPPSLTRKRASRPYLATNAPEDFSAPDEKDSPPTERYRQPGSNPGWRDDARREEINPRPTLGEEPPRPPTRSRSKAPKAKDPAAISSAARRAKRGRSVHRRRDESPDARYPSDDDYDAGKYDGYGRKYEGDGLYVPPPKPAEMSLALLATPSSSSASSLSRSPSPPHVIGYGSRKRIPRTENKFPSADTSWALSRYEDPSPPPRATTPHHASPSHHHHYRDPSRGPAKKAPLPIATTTTAPAPPEKDIREFTYLDQYEAAAAPTVSASGRRHRGSDAHHTSRKSGQWRYGVP